MKTQRDTITFYVIEKMTDKWTGVGYEMDDHREAVAEIRKYRAEDPFCEYRLVRKTADVIWRIG